MTREQLAVLKHWLESDPKPNPWQDTYYDKPKEEGKK